MGETFGGWVASAGAYIGFQDANDPNRTLLLDPVMLRECGDVSGKLVLDVGCGEGRFCRMLADRGARCVGMDLIRQMTDTARARDARGSYARGDAARLPFGDAAFDLVVSYVTLIDFPDYRRAITEMARVLRPGGALVVANLGFVTANAQVNNGWIRDESGKRLHFAVDEYAYERSQWYEWAGIRIENWHRPLSAYMQAYLAAGLTLRSFEEPVPEDDSLRDEAAYEDWYRVPLFNVMRWERREERLA